MRYESTPNLSTGRGATMAVSASVIPFSSRQINITLPEQMVQELETIAGRNGWTMQEIVVKALGLLKVANDAAVSGKRRVIYENGKPVREVVLR
jgi:hypothetical protein